METTRMLKAFERWRAKTTQTAMLLTAILALPSLAAAQQRVPEGNGDGLDTHLFRPAVDSKGFFSVNGSDILGANNISFGLVLDYGRNLMRTRADAVPQGTNTDSSGDMVQGTCKDETCVVDPGPTGDGTGVPALVRDSIQGTFGFNYGIANMAVVGLTIPVILMNGDTAYSIGPTGNTYNSAPLDAQKIETIALHGKLRLTRVDRTVGVAAVVQAGIPLGGSERDLGADPGFWYCPSS
jgi:OmpA-OmpF porin, OOP family